MRGLVPKFIMLICLLHINFRPFDPCERVLTQYLRGDDFEAILDVFEDSGEVEEQCAVIVRNVS